MLETFPDPFIAEICGQPAALRRAAAALRQQRSGLDQLVGARRRQPLLFTGMGGSYAACYGPVTALGKAGRAAVMVDSAELLYFRRPTLTPESLLVVVSQSGESAEVVRLVRGLRSEAASPFIVSVTNGAANTLAGLADVSLDSRAGPEQGPSTITFAAAVAVLAVVGELLLGTSVDDALSWVQAEADRVAGSIERFLAARGEQAQRLRSWLDGRTILSLLGRGSGRAATEMGALTLKEAAQFPAEAMQSAQFRHGPLELAGQPVAAIVVSTEPSTDELDCRLAGDLAGAGVAVLHIACDGAPAEGVDIVRLGKQDARLAAAAAIVPIQLLSWRLALDRGLRPGTYTKASKVTTRE